MDFRQYLDLLENLETEPQVGDVVEFECGDTLIETTIADLTEDGIIVHTDTTMMEMFVQGRRKINEMMRMGVDSDASASGSYKLGEEDMEEAFAFVELEEENEEKENNLMSKEDKENI